MTQGKRYPEKEGQLPESEWPPAANIEQIGKWYSKTAQKEQEKQESQIKEFESGEGIEEVLGD